MEHLKNIGRGVILGIANVIPGVSGGTLAVILNIYDKLLYAISLKNWRKNLAFLASVGGGCVIGIVVFSKIVLYLLSHYQMAVHYSLIGLILGSAPMIYKRARYEGFKLRNLVVFAIALAGMLILAWMGKGTFSGQTLAEAGGLTAGMWFRLYLSSCISMVAMILPGISGSFVMLLLGAYTISMEAISQLDILTLLPIGLGILTGGYIGIKFIKILLRFHPQALYCLILGLILGSLYTLYPGFSANVTGLLCLILMGGFGTMAFLFSKNS